MTNCTNCKHARWDVDSRGRRMASGDGRCAYEYTLPPLPASMYWQTIANPKPSGGAINRRVDLPAHCAHFAWKEKS